MVTYRSCITKKKLKISTNLAKLHKIKNEIGTAEDSIVRKLILFLIKLSLEDKVINLRLKKVVNNIFYKT
jgi:hypothetical protein